MKNILKRTVAFVILLSLCLSLLPAGSVVQGAAVDYVYAGSYIKNWGTRGETATYLSQNAVSFYEDNQTGYAALSMLSGSGTISDVPSSELYVELHELMKKNHATVTSYDGTRDLYQYTDCQNSGKTSDKISSFYSGIEIGPGWDQGGTWNREHTWPNSKGDMAGSGENDIMMLRPTSKSENSSRNNKAYGEGSNYYNPNSESSNRYDLRGDVARIVLYVYVRWECTNTGSEYNSTDIFGTNGVIESKEVLLKWIEQDPVDTWELGRNDSVQSITGTRNIFVDYPELAFCLFNQQVPTNYQTPSGNAYNSRYTITAQSNNTGWGTVSVSGNTITAIPKTGYQVAGYTILSGTAQIARSGNTFQVTPSSDVKVQINFAAKEQCTVSFAQMGTVANRVVAYTGEGFALPGHTGQIQEGYAFVGWVENTVDKTQNKPSFYQEGSSYTPTGNITLQALYSVSEGGTGNSNTFSLYTGDLTEGDYLIVYDGVAMNTTIDGQRLQYNAVTAVNNKIETPSENIVFRISADGDYWTIFNEAAGKYAAGTGAKNKATMSASVSDSSRWSCVNKGNGAYEFENKGNKTNNVNYTLRRNGTYGFACYSTSTGGSLSLYKREDGGITWYLTGGEPVEESIVTDQNGNTYGSLEAAVKNVEPEGKLTLLQDISEDVTVSKTVTLDLDGFSIDGTVTVADGCTLYGMDSQTDDYTVKDEAGYGQITAVVCNGNGKVTGLSEESLLADNAYMMVAETGGISFHSVKLLLTTVSLRATKAGIYYKSSFAGDQAVADNVEAFGVALSIVEVPTEQTIRVNCGYTVFKNFTAGNNTSAANSTLLTGIMKTGNSKEQNTTNANTVIYGRAYMLTKDNQYVFGAPVEYTLLQIVEKVDTMWTDLSASQQGALQQMYTEYRDVMISWKIPNIKGSVETEPAQTGYIKVTSADQLTDGKYVMILGSGHAPGVYDNGWLSCVQPTVSEDKVADPAGGVWTLDFTGSSVTLTDTNGVTVAPSGGNNNGIKSGSYQWSCSFEDGVVTFAGVGSDTVFLAANKTSAYKFRGYKQSTATGNPTSYPYRFTLYKLIEE